MFDPIKTVESEDQKRSTCSEEITTIQKNCKSKMEFRGDGYDESVRK